MSQVVGLDRKIKRIWLDAALDRLAQAADSKDLRAFLDEHLVEELPAQSSRARSTGIVLRIWSGVPAERLELRDRAIALLPKISGDERIWLHWGMAALAYPFFRDTVEVVGRLLTLQDDFTTAQVQARMLTTWGDRATCKEAAQKIVTMLVDWGVLRSTNKRGHFLSAHQMKASIPELQLWLLESLLRAGVADEIEAQQLLRLPESFPFQLNVGISDLRKHEGFDIHRQGLDMDMVAVRKVKVAPPPKAKQKSKRKKKAQPQQPGLFDQEPNESVSSKAKPVADSSDPRSKGSESKQPSPVQKRPRVKNAINQEDHLTLTGQAASIVQAADPRVVPPAPFAATLQECAGLLNGGHYFGCIALAHAILEAAIRHVWQIKLKRKTDQEGSFLKNLAALHKKTLLSNDLKTRLEQAWPERHSFHHLHLSEDSDVKKLEEMARRSVKLVSEVHDTLFESTLHAGTVMPAHSESRSARDDAPL